MFDALRSLVQFLEEHDGRRAFVPDTHEILDSPPPEPVDRLIEITVPAPFLQVLPAFESRFIDRGVAGIDWKGPMWEVTFHIDGWMIRIKERPATGAFKLPKPGVITKEVDAATMDHENVRISFEEKGST